MAYITDPANQTPTFGWSFNYESWIPETVITLCNVPWNNDFRDVVKFASRNALNQYIDAMENANEKIENLSPVKAGLPVRIQTPFNAASRFNYLRASNPLGPIEGNVKKDYYYFILDVREIAPNTTELIVQLDVFQTYIYDVEFSNCYIERGHIGIANEKAFDGYGRDYLTLPEGIDLGGEYQVAFKKARQIMGTYQEHHAQGADTRLNVLVLSTIDLMVINPGTVTNPNITTPTPSVIQGITSGVGVYLWENVSDFQDFIEARAIAPWILQGIVSITLVPDVRRYSPAFVIPDQGAPWGRVAYGVDWLKPLEYSLADNWRDEVINAIPQRYRHLLKLLTYPYTVIELTTNTGTPIILKPESWATDNMDLVELANYGPPNQRISIHPYKYNAIEGSDDERYAPIPGIPEFNGLRDDNGDWLDVATIISQFPTISILNNNGLIYLANSAHQLAFARQSADWSQQVALRSNQVGYDQASAGMRFAAEQTASGIRAGNANVQLANNQALANLNIDAVTGVLGNASQGAMGGAVAGPGGAAIGAGMATIGGATSLAAAAMKNSVAAAGNLQGQAISNQAATRALDINNRQSGFLRDTNKSLADWAAKGNYENEIAGQNARVQDAAMIPPTTVGQVGGAATNLIYGNMRVVAKVKMIDKAAMRRVGEYWLRYGIAVRAFGRIPSSLMVMTKFTYWKLAETYISSAPMPEGFKQIIRGIFEKGVTVWANPNDIGNIDLADNVAIEGISF